ncbi:MAG: thioether cross-link-forming SCIFF peptide maturase [Bacillota bacterium]|nr:thioether cross-link-forming SCIFF peptide maturase [Bacillota bacterium]
MPDLLPVCLQDIVYAWEPGLSEIADILDIERRRPSAAGIRRNWHWFQAADARFLLDVQSGSLHAIDDAAWDVLEALVSSCDQAGTRECAAADLAAAAGVDVSQTEEILHDLAVLIDEGTLAWPDDEDPVPSALGPGVVKAMCLHVAHDCDMRCGYCFAGTGGFGGRRSLMPPEIACAALDLLFDISGHVKHLDVDFFGGEPLLAMDTVVRAVEHGRKLEAETGKVLKFTITTNATRLTPEIGKFLNDNQIAAVLSLDGRPQVHDAVRKGASGESTFDRCSANALSFVKTRPEGPDGEYYARGTYTRKNTDFVEDVLFLADMGFASISFEPVVSPPSSPYSIRESDLDEIYRSYDRLVREMDARSEEGRGFRFFHFDLDVAKGPCLAKRLLGCGAGREYVAVTPDGELYPCHQFVGREGFVMGDVFHGIEKPEIGERFGAAHIYAKEACRDCWARYLCSGGCHANAHQMNGTLMEPYAIGCMITRKRLESALAFAGLESLRCA